MKKVTLIFLTVSLISMFSLNSMAQTTYFETNNFLLNYFTSTGSFAYNWHYEPLKTDIERGHLKGNPQKIVTSITDNTGRGYGTNFTDTTYYNAQGNITKVVALKKDIFNPKNIFQPDKYTYEYTKKGVLKENMKLTQVETKDGKKWQAHIYSMQHDNRGNITKERYQAFSKEGKDWEKYGDQETWSFTYDANGILSGGMFNNMKLTYKNGQLVKMQEGTSKPIIYTYDQQGYLNSFKLFIVDGMDIEEYIETAITLTYNEKGDIIKAVKSIWDCNSKWVRRRPIQSETFTIVYDYDSKGNWTKAVVYSKMGKQPRQTSFVIERNIQYT